MPIKVDIRIDDDTWFKVNKQVKGSHLKKMSQKMDKGHNFLDLPPSPKIMWTILNLVEKQRFDDLNWGKLG